jgi:hypothetical protein
MSAFGVNAEVRVRPKVLQRHSIKLGLESEIRLARLLLIAMCWGFQKPSLKQGAAGTVHFEPGGVAFWDNERPRGGDRIQAGRYAVF